MRRFVSEESIDTDRGLTALGGGGSGGGGLSRSKSTLSEFSTNSELFIADLLLLNLAVSGVSKNGRLYPSCIILKTMSFALIAFFQKLWFCFNFPLTDMHVLNL